MTVCTHHSRHILITGFGIHVFKYITIYLYQLKLLSFCWGRAVVTPALYSPPPASIKIKNKKIKQKTKYYDSALLHFFSMKGIEQRAPSVSVKNNKLFSCNSYTLQLCIWL